MPIAHASLGYSLDFKGNLNSNVWGVWTSPIFDTETALLTAVDWASHTINTVVPSGASVTPEFRSGASSGACAAASWVSDINTLTGQFIQMRLKLNKDDSQDAPAQCTDLQANPTSQGYAIMMEEATTNLTNYSEDFSNAYWSKGKISVIPNVCVAPDGTLTGDKIIEDNTSGWHEAYRSVFTLTQTYAASIYAKAGERSRIAIGFSNPISNGAVFDLSTGTIVQTAGSGITSKIENVGGGWYRCSVMCSSSPGTIFDIAIVQTGTTGTYTGDGASGIYIWGAQAEAKAYPTSYIKTTGGTANRNGDSLTIPTANVIDYSKGTAIFKVYINGDNLPGISKAAHVLIQPGSGGGDPFVFYRNNNAVNFAFTYGANGSYTNCLWTTDLTEGWHTLAIRWDSSEISIWANGVKKASAVPTSQPATLQTNARIGSNVADANQWNSIISEVCIYNEALTDAQMLAEGVNTSTNTNADFKMKFENNLQYDARTNELVWTSDRLDSITSQIKTGLS